MYISIYPQCKPQTMKFNSIQLWQPFPVKSSVRMESAGSAEPMRYSPLFASYFSVEYNCLSISFSGSFLVQVQGLTCNPVKRNRVVKDNLHTVLLQFTPAVLEYLHNVLLTIEICKNPQKSFSL